MHRSSLGWIAVVAVASLIVTVAVGIAQEPGAQQAPAAAPSAAPAASPTAAPTSAAAPAAATIDARLALVIAKFTGGQITVASLEEDIKRQNPFMQARFLAPEALKDLYNRTLRFELLAQEADRRNIDERPDVQEAIKQNAVQTLYRKDFDEKITPESMTDADVQKYYDEHQEEFNRPALRRASHIVVATRDEAVALIEQVKKGDVAEFRRLAREKSIDQTNKSRGGDLRYFDASGKPRGEPGASVPEAIVKAVFAMKKVGDVSAQPVAIDGGFSVVKYTGERPAESRSLADSQTSIRARLWRQKRQEAMEAFVTQLRERLKPEVHPELVDAISLDGVSPTSGIAPGFPGAPHPPADPSNPSPIAPPPAEPEEQH